MSAIEKYQAPDFPVLMQQAEMLSKSSMIPQHFRGKPGDVVAAMLLGQELGLGPMATMSHVVVINGTASLNAEGKVALVRKHGHSISGEARADKAIVTGKRNDTGDEMVVEWTMKMAERANLLKNPTWRAYPEAMLWSRAVSQLCRMLFPDVLAGLSYTEEEVRSFNDEPEPRAAIAAPPNIDTETGEIVDAEIVEEKPKRRVRKPPVAAEPTPTPDAQKANVAKAKQAVADALTPAQRKVQDALDGISAAGLRRKIGEDWTETFEGRRVADLADDECPIALMLISTHVEDWAKPKDTEPVSPVQKVKEYIADDPERPFVEPDELREGEYPSIEAFHTPQPTLDGGSPDAA